MGRSGFVCGTLGVLVDPGALDGRTKKPPPARAADDVCKLRNERSPSMVCCWFAEEVWSVGLIVKRAIPSTAAQPNLGSECRNVRALKLYGAQRTES